MGIFHCYVCLPEGSRRAGAVASVEFCWDTRHQAIIPRWHPPWRMELVVDRSFFPLVNRSVHDEGTLTTHICVQTRLFGTPKLGQDKHQAHWYHNHISIMIWTFCKTHDFTRKTISCLFHNMVPKEAWKTLNPIPTSPGLTDAQCFGGRTCIARSRSWRNVESCRWVVSLESFVFTALEIEATKHHFHAFWRVIYNYIQQWLLKSMVPSEAGMHLFFIQV